ncbi:MAG: hypothetical protein R3A10_20805 [Caldilineaceae bacterium]
MRLEFTRPHHPPAGPQCARTTARLHRLHLQQTLEEAPAAPAARGFCPLPSASTMPDGWRPASGAPTLPADVPFPAGEDEAKSRLRHFVDGDGAPIFGYAKKSRPSRRGRNHVALSALRHDLAGGGLKRTRRWTVAVKDTAKGLQTWLDELIWREFYQVIWPSSPHVRRGFSAGIRRHRLAQ